MANPLYGRDIISISELTRPEIELVLDTAKRLKEHPDHTLLKDRVIASCFFEASTRTRLSFETSIHRLGGQVIGFSDASNTSMSKKGETFADTIRIITSYADALVMRHPQEGAARLAAEVSRFRSSTRETAPTSTPPRRCLISSPSSRPRDAWTTSASPSSAT